MSTCRVVVYGDGAYDLGPDLGEDVPARRAYALPRLIHRLLREPPAVTYTAKRFPRIPPVHGRGHKYARKAMSAIRQARQGGYQAAAIVIDRDRQRTSRKLVPLRAGRDQLEHQGFPPCAVGMAVEAFDAWMIADGSAVRAADGDPAQSHPSPEALSGKEGTGGHPKDLAIRAFGGKRELAANYAEIARHVDLALLERACPQGFAPFAEEVRGRVGPVVTRRAN